MAKKKKAHAKKKGTGRSISKVEREGFRTTLEEEEFPIKLRQNKALKRLEKDVVDQEKKTDKELDEADRDVFEDPREKEEGLGIEKDEDAGIYPYP
ncbi:MAG: hypothetical protein V1944_00260, partial [Candidatus Aenigmatarchaeota archaeon]